MNELDLRARMLVAIKHADFATLVEIANDHGLLDGTDQSIILERIEDNFALVHRFRKVESDEKRD